MPSFISQYGTKPKTSWPGTGRIVGAGEATSGGAEGLPAAAADDTGGGVVGAEPRAKTSAIATTTAAAPTPMIGRRVMCVSVGAGPEVVNRPQERPVRA